MKIQKILFVLLCMQSGIALAMFQKMKPLLGSKAYASFAGNPDRTYKCLVTMYTSESVYARARMKKAFLDMINEAAPGTLLYGAFFMLADKDFLLAAAKAKARGVDVKFIVDYATVQSAKKGVDFLKKHEVPVAVYRDMSGGLMHCKFLTNGDTTLHGSANGTLCAHSKHMEYVEKNENRATAQHKLRYFECILEAIRRQREDASHFQTKNAKEWRAMHAAYREHLCHVKRARQ